MKQKTKKKGFFSFWLWGASKKKKVVPVIKKNHKLIEENLARNNVSISFQRNNSKLNNVISKRMNSFIPTLGMGNSRPILLPMGPENIGK